MKPDWNEAKTLMDHFEAKYSLEPEQHENMFKFVNHYIGPRENATVVEIGVGYGTTSIMLAYLSKKLGFKFYSVDNFCSIKGCTKENYRHRLNSLNLPYNLIVADSAEYEWRNGEIDFLFIDGNHYWPGVFNDCGNWLPHLKKGGYVAFDDTPVILNLNLIDPITGELFLNDRIDPQRRYEDDELTFQDAHCAVRFAVNHFTGSWHELMFDTKVLYKRKPLVPIAAGLLRDAGFNKE